MCWSKSRWRADPADCDAMLDGGGASAGVKLGVVSQRRFYEPVAADEGGHRRRQDRPARCSASIDHVQLARRGLLPLRPVARQVGHRRRRRARQPVAAPARPAALVHGAGRRGQRLLGQPQPSRHRGRRHGRGHRSASADGGLASIVDQPRPEARHLHQGPRPRLQRRLGRRGDRPRRDVHRRHVGHRRAARSTTSGPFPARSTCSRSSRTRTGRISQAWMQPCITIPCRFGTSLRAIPGESPDPS